MPNIQLHKEFGLNPTIAQCIICREDKGEIALLGSVYKGEAPKHMIVDVEPCDLCRKKFLSKGILLVEADSDYKGKKTPTGNFAVLKDKAFVGIFDTEIPPRRIAFVEIGVFNKLGIQ